jgi:hypothetical protein
MTEYDIYLKMSNKEFEKKMKWEEGNVLKASVKIIFIGFSN